MTDKIILTNVGSLIDATTAATTINNNSAIIEAAMNNTLSRDGTSPNTMLNTLDMNSNPIINLPAPATANSPARLQDLSTLTGGGTVSSLPAGGTTGQVLTKISATDYATNWQTTSGSGTVTSVGLALPADFTITNSPVTTTGTLTGAWATTPTGSGAVVRTTSPTLVSPILGTPTSVTLSNASGLPTTALTGILQTAQIPALTGDVTNSAASTATTIANNAVTNAKAAQMVASTFKGNPTGSTANATDFTIDGLTLKGSPAASDEVIIWDVAGTALKKATISTIGSAGSVSSIAGNTGAFTLTQPITNATNAILLNAAIQPGGRITLVSATPVMTTTTSGATTVYYTPYIGNLVPLYDGTNMIPTAFAEVSQLTTDTTKSPAAVVASSIYDLFAWNDSGTLRVTRGPVWTNATTRSAGTILVRTNGIWLNSVSITNGPAASRGTYVGTIASNGSSAIDYIFGAAASGGTAASLMVWNMYNRVDTGTKVTDNGTSYTYASATVRQARASAGNQISFVVGQSEDAVRSTIGMSTTSVNTLNAFASYGIGLDNTAAFLDGATFYLSTSTAANLTMFSSTSSITSPAIGTHILSMNQAADGTTTATYNSAASFINAIIRN